MGSLLDLLQQQIGDGEIRRMSRTLDADEDQDDALELGKGLLGSFLKRR